MTWSYSAALSTDRDKTRLKIGDTNTNDQLLTNEAIDLALSDTDDVVLAAITCVKWILAKLARDIDRSTQGPTSSRSQKTTHYRELLADLEAEAYGSSGCEVGGVSTSAKDSIESDSDFIRPTFAMGMDDK